ncbi:NrfD/PsrC family molybdoenzyme membrane anchor subunit [Salmonella enterica subsp. enterica serovar Soerenga]
MTSASAFHFASLVWDWPIAIYLFLIGISAGLVTLAILLRRFHPEAGGSDSTLLRTTLVLGPGAIILGLLILVFHLTRPWTFWKLMFHYSFTSVMSMGVMLFQLYMVVLVLWLAKIFEKEVIALQQRWLPRLEIVQKVLALITPFHRALETLMLALGDDGKMRALAAALGGGFWSWWFWLGVVGLGLIIPLLLKPWANRSVTFHGVLAVCGASLTGVLLLRFFILYAGQLTVA